MFIMDHNGLWTVHNPVCTVHNLGGNSWIMKIMDGLWTLWTTRPTDGGEFRCNLVVGSLPGGGSIFCLVQQRVSPHISIRVVGDMFLQIPSLGNWSSKGYGQTDENSLIWQLVMAGESPESHGDLTKSVMSMVVGRGLYRRRHGEQGLARETPGWGGACYRGTSLRKTFFACASSWILW